MSLNYAAGISTPRSAQPGITRLFVFFSLVLFNTTYAQIRVDGILNPGEWGHALKTSGLHFDFGSCYYTFQRDTLFLAFDVIADNSDNKAGSNELADKVEIYVDVNNDNIHSKEDYTFTAGSLTRNGGLVKTCASCKPTKGLNRSNGIFATSIGTSPVFKDYNHRIWEIAIPLKLLPVKGNTGFGYKVTSAYPKFSALKLNDLGNDGYGYSMMIRGAAINISPQESTYAPQQPKDNSEIVTGRRILDDGGVELTYADGHKRINYSGGYTIITPDGIKRHVTFMSVPKFIPPSLPDANVNRWLDSLNSSLKSLIAEWLNNDQASLANMMAGENGKNIYEIINRRCSIINYLNPYKK